MIFITGQTKFGIIFDSIVAISFIFIGVIVIMLRVFADLNHEASRMPRERQWTPAVRFPQMILSTLTSADRRSRA